MKHYKEFFLPMLVYVFIALFLAAIQTTLWHQFFGSFPGPLLWLSLTTWLTVHKSQMKTIVIFYFLTPALMVFTEASYGALLISLIGAHLVLFQIKERLQGSGKWYVTTLVGANHLLFFASKKIIAKILGTPDELWIYNILIHLLLIPIYAPFIYKMLDKIDFLINPPVPMAAVDINYEG